MPTTESPTYGPRAGLIAAHQAVPLEGVSVDATITSAVARVTIQQRYRNRETQPVEAVYVFPLDEGAAVCGFEAVSDGVHYIGEVKPRDEAFRDYDDALVAGHRAYLLDEERPDVFTASIGNLPPGAEVLIKITYVTEVAMEGGALRFMLPTTVSPRYAPSKDRAGIGRSESEALNPPVAWRVPYGLDLTMTFRMPGPIGRIESPSHPIAVTLDGPQATVTLAQASVALDRDVVVVVDAAGLLVPLAIVERRPDGGHAAAVVFHPAAATDPAPADVVFVVDRSGSMEGSSIAEVRNALQLCLRSLVPGSRFDIVSFGDRVVSLFKESVAYDDTALARASEHVAALDANLGGTEILPALQAVLDRPPSDLPRQLVVFTDGEVTNTEAVLALIGAHAGTVRVFAFGIGRGASAHLVRGMARAGRGAAEFIYPGERLEAKVVRQFARVMAPGFTEVTVDWGGLDARTATATLPVVFAGSRLVVYGWLEGPRAAKVTLTARGPSGLVSFPVPLDAERATEATTVSSLAARARIRELEEGAEWLQARGSRQTGRRANQSQAEIVRLACSYGLVSRETSFVAIERRGAPVEGEMQLRRIPVALTSGWGRLNDHALLASRPVQLDDDVDEASFSAALMMPRTHRGGLDRSAIFPVKSVHHRVPARAHLWRRLHGGADPEPASAAPRAPLDVLVALQRADGSWDLTDALAAGTGVPAKALESGVGGVSSTADDRRVWATLVALAWLASRAADSRDEWGLLAQKAEHWLASAASDAAAMRAWRHAAEALVG